MPFEPKMIPTQAKESGMKEGEGTYNSGVMPRLYNKLVMVLSAIGMFIAGVLTYSEFADKEVPCGVDGGCSLVTSSPFSKIWEIPVAVIGLVGYVVFLGLSYLRSQQGDEKWALLSKIGFWMSVGGFGFSLWLQIVSLTQLSQICEWCLASAVTMFALFVAHALLMQAGPPKKKAGVIDWTFAPVVAIIALGAVGVQAASMDNPRMAMMGSVDFNGVSVDDIKPDESRMMGDSDAKLTIIEFADVNCGVCREAYPELHKAAVKYGGKLRIGYRHYPLFNLPGHEFSTLIAMVAEYAADHGKYFEFLDAAYDPGNSMRVKSEAGVYGIAGDVGLDIADLKGKMDIAEDVTYFDRVTADFTLAKDMLKIKGTPTFIIFGEGIPPEVIDYRSIESTLKRPRFAELLK